MRAVTSTSNEFISLISNPTNHDELYSGGNSADIKKKSIPLYTQNKITTIMTGVKWEFL